MGAKDVGDIGVLSIHNVQVQVGSRVTSNLEHSVHKISTRAQDSHIRDSEGRDTRVGLEQRISGIIHGNSDPHVAVVAVGNL